MFLFRLCPIRDAFPSNPLISYLYIFQKFRISSLVFVVFPDASPICIYPMHHAVAAGE